MLRSPSGWDAAKRRHACFGCGPSPHSMTRFVSWTNAIDADVRPANSSAETMTHISGCSSVVTTWRPPAKAVGSRMPNTEVVTPANQVAPHACRPAQSTPTTQTATLPKRISPNWRRQVHVRPVGTQAQPARPTTPSTYPLWHVAPSLGPPSDVGFCRSTKNLFRGRHSAYINSIPGWPQIVSWRRA